MNRSPSYPAKLRSPTLPFQGELPPSLPARHCQGQSAISSGSPNFDAKNISLRVYLFAQTMESKKGPYTLPPLPYPTGALEPYVRFDFQCPAVLFDLNACSSSLSRVVWRR